MTVITSVTQPPPIAPDYPTLASFGHDPWWLIALKVVVIFAFLMITTLMTIWAERRIIGRMQSRPGPNRAGKYGLLQSLMDGLKLPLKEDIIPPFCIAGYDPQFDLKPWHNGNGMTLDRATADLHRARDLGDSGVHQLRDHPVRA